MSLFEFTFKPTAMSRKHRRFPEYVAEVVADNQAEATASARRQAEIEGFAGYAITKIKEIKQ